MYSNSEDEIISGTWAISQQHANAWLLMVAQILKGNHVQNHAQQSAIKTGQIEMRRYIVDKNGDRIERGDHAHTPADSIGVVQIVGPMIKYGNWWSWGADELIAFAEEFERDPNIIGQIWIMDSGGGAMTSIAPYLEFLRRKTKPVIALADICASANYYVAAGCDQIFARNKVSSMFGSIGVMATILDYAGYLKEMGIKEHLIYASQSSWKHKSYNEALKGNYKEFKKEHLDPAAIKFQQFVKSNRKKLNTDIEGIIEGRMFYSEEALQHKMIDGILDFEEAADRVKVLANTGSIMFN